MAVKPKSEPWVVPVPSDRLRLDPRFISRLMYDSTIDAVGTGGTVPLVGTDYDRWAIGFFATSGGFGTSHVAPWQDEPSVLGWTLVAGTPVWLSQDDYGPLIGQPWSWFGSTMLASLRVITIRRLT